MKGKMNKKILYGITSSVAIFILGFGIIVSTNTFNNKNVRNPNCEIADLEQDKQNSEEGLKIDLQINKIEKIALASIDADIETISSDKIPNEFKFMESIIIPQEFKLTDIYKVYVRSNHDIKKYDLLHDYVFSYKKDDKNDIRIAASTIEKPIRDYFLEDSGKISKIGDIDLKIFQYKDMYMSAFKIGNIYLDIEAKGISENELVILLESIINI